jgi:hypothetical protein
VTNHRVELAAHEAVGLTEAALPGQGIQTVAWEDPANLSQYPISAPVRRLISWIVERPRKGEPGGR